MKQEDFEKAKEIDNRIAELTLKAEAAIQTAKRIENLDGTPVLDNVSENVIRIKLDKDALKILSEYYYKRHNDIQKRIGELKKEFYNI